MWVNKCIYIWFGLKTCGNYCGVRWCGGEEVCTTCMYIFTDI